MLGAEIIVAAILRKCQAIDEQAVAAEAAATGRATIRATGTIYCKPGVVCPDLALLWSLEVIVT